MSFMQAIITEYRGRAISHRPDLAGRVHLLSTKSDEIGAPALNDYTDYANVHAQHIWVRKGIKIISDNLSVLPIVVVNDENEPIPNHPLTQLFNFVSDRHSPSDLWAAWVSHMILGGESFVELLPGQRGQPVQLWARRPDLMGVYPDASRAWYPAAAGYVFSDELEYAADEVIHWKFDNPLNPWRGLSLIGAVRHGLTIDIFAQAWSKKFLKDGGNPDWALIAPQGITKTEREAYELTIAQKFLGWENWHKPIILEEGVTDIKPLSFPPKDMQWLEQRNLARDEIGAIIGVPDVLLGVGPETYDTEEKRATAERSLYRITIVPLVKKRDDQLNTFFTKVRPMLKGNEYIKTDLSGVGVLQEDVSPKVETAKGLWAMGVPFNRIDERLGLGIGEIPGGDLGYLPLNLLPASLAGYSTPPGQMAPGQAQLWTVAEKETPRLIGPGGTSPVYDSIEHRIFMRQRDHRVRPYEIQTVRMLKKYFQRQQVEVGRLLRERTGQKQEAVTLPPVTELFDVETEAQLLRGELSPLLAALIAEAGGGCATL
jgi:HK97 family phage portal protein